MRVLLKFELDCTPDAAYRAITSPAVFRQVSSPLLGFRSLEPAGFPDQWTEGVHPVTALALGIVPVGDQTVELAFLRKGDTRIVRDTGRGLSGSLAFVTDWEHSMAVSPLRGGRTLYRDQLVFGVSPVTALAWPVMWSFWQWRGRGIRRLAPTWV
jgi:hypothetical protein